MRRNQGGATMRTFIIPLSVAALGIVAITAGFLRAIEPADPERTIINSAALSLLVDAGAALRDGVERIVEPAIVRTQLLAADPRIVHAAHMNDTLKLTQLANEAVTSSTEIDTFAIFSDAGEIQAINTLYASGAPVDSVRVAQVFSEDFDERGIIQGCTSAGGADSVLQFQRSCDITPAYFDSAGLSVAYSVPIIDRASGQRVGVASSRICFDRIEELLGGREIAEGRASLYFISDDGEYFSEEIAAGQQAPPIPHEELARIVSALSQYSTDDVLTRHETSAGTYYVSRFPLHSLNAATGSGISVLMLGESHWVAHDVAMVDYVQALGMGVIGLLLLLMAGLVRHCGVQGLIQKDLHEANAQAEGANRAKSEFLANMSHEIRTPMTAILGYTDLLMDSRSSEEDRARHSRTIQRNGVHLLSIINDILDVSKIEAGKLNVERIECSPYNIVEDVCCLMRERAMEHNVELVVEHVLPIPRTIQSDPVRLRQIFINLLGNAVKFTREGSIGVRMWFDCPEENSAESSCLVIEVRDSGIGMSNEQLSRLFTPFEQADSTTTRRFGGAGLGLTITRRLCQMLGGDVEVSSSLGVGSVFTARIETGPINSDGLIQTTDDLKISSGACSNASEGQSPALAAADALADGPPLAGRRILLAEDGPDNQRLFVFHLKKAGAEVSVASDGRVALHKALEARDASTEFDLILMDMQTPEMDGYTATAELRRHGVDTPVVALTAHAMAGDRERCLEAGCDDYATKPIKKQDLLKVCATWCGKRSERASPDKRAA